MFVSNTLTALNLVIEEILNKIINTVMQLLNALTHENNSLKGPVKTLELTTSNSAYARRLSDRGTYSSRITV